MTYLGFGANEAMARHQRHLFLGKLYNIQYNYNILCIIFSIIIIYYV